MYKNRLILLSILLISIFTINPTVPCIEASGFNNLDEVLIEVENANIVFKTLRANIVFTRTIKLLESNEVSKGYLSYKKPNKLYLKFYPPRYEINIVNGKYVWIYHPKEKQVEKYELSNSRQSTQGISFFEFGYGESINQAKINYMINLLDVKEVAKKKFYILDMIPKDPKAQYSEIKLWIEEGFWLPNRIELYESGGEVVNMIELTNITLNKGMSDKLFIFDVPRGVEVIEPLK